MKHSSANPAYIFDRISSVGVVCRESGPLDAASFTGGKGEISRRTTSPSTDDESVGTVPSESDSEQLNARLNEDQLVQLPEPEFPMIKDQAAQEPMEDVIEAMRLRGSRDYIVGGTAL